MLFTSPWTEERKNGTKTKVSELPQHRTTTHLLRQPGLAWSNGTGSGTRWHGRHSTGTSRVAPVTQQAVQVVVRWVCECRDALVLLPTVASLGKHGLTSKPKKDLLSSSLSFWIAQCLWREMLRIFAGNVLTVMDPIRPGFTGFELCPSVPQNPFRDAKFLGFSQSS